MQWLDVNTGDRSPGCEVKLEDYGKENHEKGIKGKQQSVPVCMGGLGITGCNRGSTCGPLLKERGLEEGVDFHPSIDDDDVVVSLGQSRNTGGLQICFEPMPVDGPPFISPSNSL